MSPDIVAAGTSAIAVAAIALIVAAKFELPLLIVPFPFVAGWANDRGDFVRSLPGG